MKNILFLVGVLALVSLAGADVNMSVGLTTDGDINSDFWLNAGGNIDVNIDGLNYRSNLQSNRRSTQDWILWTFEDAINTLHGQNAKTSEGSYLADLLSSYFIGRPDYNVLVDRQDSLYTSLYLTNIRLEVAENTLKEIAPIKFCINSLKALLKYGLDNVRCDGSMYYNAYGNNTVLVLAHPELNFKRINPRQVQLNWDYCPTLMNSSEFICLDGVDYFKVYVDGNLTKSVFSSKKTVKTILNLRRGNHPVQVGAKIRDRGELLSNVIII